MAMRALPFLLVWHIVQGASNQVSLHALRAVEAGATRAQTLAGFRKYADNLVATYQKQGQPIEQDDDTWTAIDTILSYLTSLYADMLVPHNDQQMDIAQCTEGYIFDYCESKHLNATTLGQLEQAKNKTAGARATFLTQINQCAECPGDECSEYERYRETQEALWSVTVRCASPPPGDFSDEFIRADEGSDDLDAMESCLGDAHTWMKGLYPKYEECAAKRDLCTASKCKDPCASMQKQFEIAHCEWDIVEKLHCDGFDQCYKNHYLTCKDRCDGVETESKARAADNETAERIKCLLEVLRSPEDDKEALLTDCKNKFEEYEEKAKFWLLECNLSDNGTVPIHHPCHDVIWEPCSQNFLDNEYHKEQPDGLGLKQYDRAAYENAQTCAMAGPCEFECTTASGGGKAK